MNSKLNPLVDQYLIDGCMRCKYEGTPACKVNNWRDALVLLREIALESGLKEEIKWGVPVYTHKDKNIITVNALKGSANVGFFKGALLADPQQILSQQGNLQSDRIIKFTTTESINAARDIILTYIAEAIAVEEAGKKVVFKKNPEQLPVELAKIFDEDPDFMNAFNALTPGRQRGYIIHFSQPKKPETRIARIKKQRATIFDGEGLNDQYQKK